MTPPQQPEREKQLHAGDSEHIIGDTLWCTDSKGNYWCGHTHHRTPEQLMRECKSTIRDLEINHPELFSSHSDMAQPDYQLRSDIWICPFQPTCNYGKDYCEWPCDKWIAWHDNKIRQDLLKDLQKHIDDPDSREGCPHGTMSVASLVRWMSARGYDCD